MKRDMYAEYLDMTKEVDDLGNALAGLNDYNAMGTLPILGRYANAIAGLYTKISRDAFEKYFTDLYAYINNNGPAGRNSFLAMLAIMETYKTGHTESAAMQHFKNKFHCAAPIFDRPTAISLDYEQGVEFDVDKLGITDELIQNKLSQIELFGNEVLAGIVPGSYYIPFEYGEKIHVVKYIDYYPLAVVKPVPGEPYSSSVYHLIGEQGLSAQLVVFKKHESDWSANTVLSLRRNDEDHPYLKAHFSLRVDDKSLEGYQLGADSKINATPNGLGPHDGWFFFQQFNTNGMMYPSQTQSPDYLNTALKKIPAGYENRRKIAPHVVCFNQAENVTHPGTNNMIDFGLLRELFAKILRDEFKYFETNAEVMRKYPVVTDDKIIESLDTAFRTLYPNKWLDGDNFVGLRNISFASRNYYQGTCGIDYEIDRANRQFHLVFTSKQSFIENFVPNFAMRMTYSMDFSETLNGYPVKGIDFVSLGHSDRPEFFSQRCKSYLMQVICDHIQKYNDALKNNY